MSNYKKIKNLIKMMLPYFMVYKHQPGYIFTKESSVEPIIYNSKGEKKRTFYLQDNLYRTSPYTLGSINIAETNYFNWDRFNKALPIHFYSHDEIFSSANEKPYKKFAILLESEKIDPVSYNKCLNNPSLMNSFNGIFTHSEEILEKFNNAYFIPGGAVWYGGNKGGGELEPSNYKNKTKMISIVSSNKHQCELHKVRIRIANLLLDNSKVDVFGTVNGGKYINIVDSLKDYRYSIAIENNCTNIYFTEKIMNCFASMTVPIYIGAKKISSFFNEKGIIQISPNISDNELNEIINMCSEEDYLRRREAIIDNFNRAKQYVCIEDYIYRNYSDLFN